jgi:hypothetical protein
MEALFSPKTFVADHLTRNSSGSPIGRIILVNDSSYVPGENIRVLMYCVPVSTTQSILGSSIYVDGLRYKVPQDIPSFRLNRRDKEWIASSFVLVRYPHES